MNQKKTTENWKSLGIPEKYHIKLQRLAKKNHRTISGQMAALIDAAQNSGGGSLPQAEAVTAE